MFPGKEFLRYNYVLKEETIPKETFINILMKYQIADKNIILC